MTFLVVFILLSLVTAVLYRPFILKATKDKTKATFISVTLLLTHIATLCFLNYKLELGLW